MMNKTWIGCIVVSLVVAQEAHAVTMSWLFDHNMVLQADQAAPVWGQGTPGETVTVSFGGLTNSTVVDAGGQWTLNLSPMEASTEGRTMLIDAPSGSKVVTNVLVGDVWVCSGQSNMAQPTMGQAIGFETETNEPLNHMIRAYYAPYNIFAFEPQTNNFPGSRISNWHYWTTVAARTPAVPYYFAKKLQVDTGRPVGLLVVPVGASNAECWVPMTSMLNDVDFYPFATQTVHYFENYTNNLLAFDQELADWEAAKAEAEANNEPFTTPQPTKNFRPEFSPRWWASALYNAYIAPMRNMAVTGVIWYQGENNAAGMGGAVQTSAGYQRLMELLVQSWRAQFDRPTLPFYQVQLSMFNWNDFNGQQPRDPVPGSWTIIREGQENASRSIPYSGMAVSVDIGEKADIHPRNKRPVGERLALLALRDVYGQAVIADGPAYLMHTIEGNAIRVTFTNTFGGLVRGERPEVTGDEVVGFAVAGTDEIFYWADAEIQGDDVVVSSPEVSSPVAVRYAYAQYQDVNLFNAEGLPAIPFRSDDWNFEPSTDLPIDELDVLKADNTNDLNLVTSWVEGVVPGAANVALWDATVTAANTVHVGTSLVLSGIKIFDPGGKVTIKDAAGETNTLTLGFSGINMANANKSMDITVPVNLATSQTWEVKTDLLLDANSNGNFGGLKVDNQGHDLTVAGGGAVDIEVLTGSGGIVKNGAGFLRMQANGIFDFTGNVRLENGTIRAGNRSGALGSGSSTLTLAGGTLTFNSNLAINFGRDVIVSGDATIHNNNSSNNGGQTYTFKSLSIGADTLTVTAQGTNAANIVLGPALLSGNAVFDVASRSTNTLRVGSISESAGSFGFTKRGIGTLILTNASTFTGSAVIDDGVVVLTHPGSLGASTSVIVRSSLDVSRLSAGFWSLASGQTLGGTGTVAGALVVDGTLAPGDDETPGVLHTGDLVLNAGMHMDWRAGSNAHDRVSANGSFSLGPSFSGTLRVIDAGGAVSSSDQLVLLAWTAGDAPVINAGDWTVHLPAGWTGTPVVTVDEAQKQVVLSGVQSGSGGGGTPAQPVLMAPEMTAGGVRFEWLTESGRSYSVEYSDNLLVTNGWLQDPLFTNRTAVEAIMMYTNPDALFMTSRYYRVLSE